MLKAVPAGSVLDSCSRLAVLSAAPRHTSCSGSSLGLLARALVECLSGSGCTGPAAPVKSLCLGMHQQLVWGALRARVGIIFPGVFTL